MSVNPVPLPSLHLPLQGSYTSGSTVSRTASQLEALKEEHQHV
jgi:hypothetical protein